MTRAKSNPTVAFDTWVVGERARNQGVHVYGTQLLHHFRELAPQYSLEFKPFVSGATQQNGCALTPAPGFAPMPTRLLAHSRLWRFGGAWASAALQGADLVFNPHCASFYGALPVPTVTTIHDAIPLVQPWPSPIARTLRFLLWSAAKASRAIITVSEHSKADLIRTYGLPDSQVHVVYNGCDHSVFNDIPTKSETLAAAKKKLGFNRSYILHYGAIRPSKNLARLVRAYRQVLSRNADWNLDLVLAGVLDSGAQEVMEVIGQRDRDRGRVLITGPLGQQDLVTIIKGAALAVFPSLYEGFCLPMIESMACGTPTIASSSSCLPEISGSVLRYFDPTSEDEMSACIESALKDEDLRRELSQRGRERALQFDWRRCAGQTLEILASVAWSGRSHA